MEKSGGVVVALGEGMAFNPTIRHILSLWANGQAERNYDSERLLPYARAMAGVRFTWICAVVPFLCAIFLTLRHQLRPAPLAFIYISGVNGLHISGGIYRRPLLEL